jgi:hypothetical protein
MGHLGNCSNGSSMGEVLSNDEHGRRWGGMDLDPPDGFELPSISLMYTIRKADLSTSQAIQMYLHF